MDDDRSTTFSVSFMGQNKFMGVVDQDKVSTIVLVNKVMKLVNKRKMTWDERFKLTVTQPWDNHLVKIIDDDELFNLWSRYNHEGLYHIDFELEIISSPVGSSRTKQTLIPGNDTDIQTGVSDDDEIQGREIQTRDFYVVRPTLPTSTPPSFPGLRIPLSKPPRLQMLTLDFQGVNGPLQQEIIPNLLTQVYPNTYNHSKFALSPLTSRDLQDEYLLSVYAKRLRTCVKWLLWTLSVNRLI
ncbi:hypothetical protein WN944_001629 [Citrus x changshan-huyou]|uniref:Uncharacterized protein n=1 Tax=Citrus x changshan-huyou TaxID=2935761 RepID=A0AAP0MF30_9ROSI